MKHLFQMTQNFRTWIILLASALVTVDCQLYTRNCLSLCDTTMNVFQLSCANSYVESYKSTSTVIVCTECSSGAVPAWPSYYGIRVSITGCCSKSGTDKCWKFFYSGDQDPLASCENPCSAIVDQPDFASVKFCLTGKPNDLQEFMSCIRTEAESSSSISAAAAATTTYVSSHGGSSVSPNVGKNQLDPSQVVGIAVGVSVGVAVLIIVVVVIIFVLRRRRRPPMHAKDLDHIATAPATTTNVYQTVPSLAPSAPTLYQDINSVNTTATKQTTSDYEEPEPVVGQQRNEVQPIPDKTPPTHDPAATHGDTTLIDNTLYNMDNNPTTCLTTTARDPTSYSDTTLIDNSLYHMQSNN